MLVDIIHYFLVHQCKGFHNIYIDVQCYAFEFISDLSYARKWKISVSLFFFELILSLCIALMMNDHHCWYLCILLTKKHHVITYFQNFDGCYNFFCFVLIFDVYSEIEIITWVSLSEGLHAIHFLFSLVLFHLTGLYWNSCLYSTNDLIIYVSSSNCSVLFLDWQKQYYFPIFIAVFLYNNYKSSEFPTFVVVVICFICSSMLGFLPYLIYVHWIDTFSSSFVLFFWSRKKKQSHCYIQRENDFSRFYEDLYSMSGRIRIKTNI